MPKKKPKRRKKEQHPTLFVMDGSIRIFEEGSMLELHTQISQEEWEAIVEETIKYKVFVECLKEIAIPKLDEKWEPEDDWFRVQLDVAISRMRNIDALIVAKHNQEDIKKVYSEEIKKNAAAMTEFIKEVREQQRQIMEQSMDELSDTTRVSDL